MKKGKGNFRARFKAKVPLEAVSWSQTFSELSTRYGVHATIIPGWKKMLTNIPNDNEYFKSHANIEKLCQIKEGETKRPAFKRLHRFKYSPTVCYGNNEVHLHPYSQRRLSVSETLRSQGVPDSFILKSSGQLSE